MRSYLGLSESFESSLQILTIFPNLSFESLKLPRPSAPRIHTTKTSLRSNKQILKTYLEIHICTSLTFLTLLQIRRSRHLKPTPDPSILVLQSFLIAINPYNFTILDTLIFEVSEILISDT